MKAVDTTSSEPLLESDSRWIVGREGRHSVDDQGQIWSHRWGERHELKTTIKNGYRVIRIYDRERVEPITYRVGDLVAEAFLGTRDFIFKDGDREHVALTNIQPVATSLEVGERWLDGCEGLYSVAVDGAVWSYQRHQKKKLKSCDSRSQYRRVTLYVNGEQMTHYLRD